MDSFGRIQSSRSCDYTEWLNFTPVQVGADFFTNLEHCRDDGEKILLFMETAKRLDVPLRAIGEILTYRDEVLVALAIQSLAYITNLEIRSKLLNLELIEGIDVSLEEIYQLHDPHSYKPYSVQILEELCRCTESRTDLVSVSAAWVIDKLGYSPVHTGKLLHRSVRRIQEDILHEYAEVFGEKGSRIRESQVQAKRYADFWTFSPREYLVDLIHSLPTGDCLLLNVVTERLGVLGVETILKADPLPGKNILCGIISIAGSRFIDQKYKNFRIQKYLTELILPFLSNDFLEVRKSAAEALSSVAITSQLEINTQAKIAILLKKWNKAIEIGEPSLPLLLDVINGKLKIDDTSNVSQQVEAVKCIEFIFDLEPHKKVSILMNFLIHPSLKVGQATANALKKNVDLLDLERANLLESLIFKLDDQITEALCDPGFSNHLKILSITDLEVRIKEVEIEVSQMIKLFSESIESCKSLEIKSYLEQAYKTSHSSFVNYINLLKNQLEKNLHYQECILHNHELLSKVIRGFFTLFVTSLRDETDIARYPYGDNSSIVSAWQLYTHESLTHGDLKMRGIKEKILNRIYLARRNVECLDRQHSRINSEISKLEAQMKKETNRALIASGATILAPLLAWFVVIIVVVAVLIGSAMAQ